MNFLTISTTFMSDGEPLFKALDLCESVGIKSIEIGSNHSFEKNYDYLNDYNFNFIVHNYFPIPKNSFVLNIASFNPEIRLMSINHIKKAIDFCLKIGAGLYTFHPGFLSDPKGSNLAKNNFDFQWDEKQLEKASHTKAKELMFLALDEVVKYAMSKRIKVAIESEGSVSKKDHLLMQQPKEYEEFMKNYSVDDIGVNLNIGHLNLAANAFNFNRSDFVDLIQKYIIAMELSHNDGKEDQHLPLESDAWYWNLIKDARFESKHKILEFRNTSIHDIAKNILMIQNKYAAV